MADFGRFDPVIFEKMGHNTNFFCIPAGYSKKISILYTYNKAYNLHILTM
jgi:NRPS condensation-like uncharacterized protein